MGAVIPLYFLSPQWMVTAHNNNEKKYDSER